MNALAHLFNPRAAALLILAGLGLCRLAHHLTTTPKEGER